MPSGTCRQTNGVIGVTDGGTLAFPTDVCVLDKEGGVGVGCNIPFNTVTPLGLGGGCNGGGGVYTC